MACRGALLRLLLLCCARLALAKQLNFERQKPKVANPNGPCSTVLELPERGAALPSALAEVGWRLGIDAAKLTFEDGEEVADLDSVPARTLLTVHEVGAQPAAAAAAAKQQAETPLAREPESQEAPAQQRQRVQPPGPGRGACTGARGGSGRTCS
mmetsp:Transcript_64255/g.198927  ORF Transcript_64255/g.198927 Transcript_64255/m.198927 type:complete len:155 (+) Transcript_64255:39-503(+)